MLSWFRGKLPEYATKADDGTYEIDPDVAYPLWLGRLGLPWDQFALEVCRRCFTKEMLEIVGKRDDSPLRLRITKDDRWALKNFSPGLGAEAGADGFRPYWNKWKEGIDMR